MSTHRSFAHLVAASLALLALSAHALAAQANAPAAQPVRATRVAIAQQMPPLDGSKVKVSVIEVNYAPGATSMPHSHPCPVIGYVAEGAIRFQVKGDVEKVLRAGETFYEPPDGVHLVSGNASATAPARLIATFVCDNDRPMSVPAK